MKSWRKLAQRDILRHPRLHVVEDEVELPSGSKIQYLRFVDDKDYVTTIAREPGQPGKFAMVFDYSYPNDVRLLQFSEGLIDAGETPAEAAERELLEEMGIRAKKFITIGWNLSHHRRSTAKNFIIVAEGLTETGQTQHEAEEAGMQSYWLNEAEITQKIARGEIVQKNSLAAWAIYQAWRARQNS